MKLLAMLTVTALSSNPVCASETYEQHLGSWSYHGRDGDIWVSLRPHGECSVIATLSHTIARVVRCTYAVEGPAVTLAEKTAQTDPRFKELLGWLIPAEPNTETWKRNRNVAGDVEW